VATGKKVGVFEGHTGPVNTVRFSNNGKSFASASDDHTVRLWPLDKKLFLSGTYFEKEIEDEISGSALVAPRGSNETKQDYAVREADANRKLETLYEQYYQEYIEMLGKLSIDKVNN
jgi:WD40 repeat protein